MEKIDYAIVGAGIIGISVALKLVKTTKATVVLFEKENFFGDHTSARNSGVLHSGIYYQNNSLKHQLCIESLELWEKISKELDFEINHCGKFIFADKDQSLDLEKIFENGTKNQVRNLRYANKNELLKLNEFVNAENALWVGSTSIVDQPTVLKKMMNEFENLGGIYLKNHEVIKVLEYEDNRFRFVCKNDLLVESSFFINAAGLFGIELRSMFGLTGIENYFVKGSYLNLINKKITSSELIYPIPEKNLKGLGVHLTINWDGSVKFGPNTEDVTSIDYSLNEESLSEMKNIIQKTFKNISQNNLTPNFCGIRPKIKIAGNVYPDFYIEQPIKGYIELLGIESPGFTSSLAIANRVRQLIN